MRNRKKIYCLALSVLFLFFLGFSAFAEENEIEEITKFIKKKRINAGYLMFGACKSNFPDLNSFLQTKQMPELGEHHLSFGVGGHVISNKLVVGIEILRTLPNNTPGTGSFNTSAKIKYSVLNFGYLLKPDKGLMYYPYVGLGIGILAINVTENNIDSFNDFSNFQKGSEATKTCFLANIGFAIDYFDKYNVKKKGRNSLVIGVRAGYITSISRSDWRINHIKVPDGPKASISGPYIRFTIGIGGWVEKLVKIVI